MNLRRREVLLFVVVAGIAIAWLVFSGLDTAEDPADRYTGRRSLTPAAVLDEARATGRAEAALPIIINRRSTLSERAALDSAAAVLQAELAKTGTPTEIAHPARSAIDRALADRKGASEALAAAVREPMDARAVAQLLERLEADAAIAEATEAFFALPSGAEPPAADVELPRASDGAAAIVRNLTDPTADVMLKVAETFRAAGRRRGWNRWLRRAFEAHPSNPDCATQLAGFYIAEERQREALLVLRTTDVEASADILNLRAQVAGWLGMPRVEADASEKLLELHDTPELRERLIELLRFGGQSARAVPHARALVETRGSAADRERAIEVALEAGLLDEAILFAETAVASAAADAKRSWRERIVRMALNDLRLDRAMVELEFLVREHPDGRFADDDELTYDQQLEWLYRAREKDIALLDLLVGRLDRGPPAAERRGLEDDIIYIAQRVGRLDQVRSIFTTRMAAANDAKTYVADFWDYETAGVPGRVEKGLVVLVAADTDEATAITLYTLLEERMDPSLRRPTLERLIERYPQSSVFEHRYRVRLDEVDPLASATRFEALVNANPGDLELVRGWVVRASWINDVERQRRSREALRALAPDDRENRRMLVDLYEALARPDDALQEWRYLAETADTEDVETERRLIGSLLANDRYPEALPRARALVERPGATDGDRLVLLDVLQTTGNYEDALPFARTRAERDDASPQDRARYLDLLQATERYAEALPLARERAAAPDATDADQERLAQLLVATGAYEEVLPGLRARASRSRQDEDWLVDVLQALERHDEVIAIMKRRATADDAPYEDRRAFGDALLGGGRYDAAQRVYGRLLEDKPDDRHVLLRLAQAHAWNEDPRGAMPYARQRLALAEEAETPKEQRERAETLFTLGEALWAVEQKDAARRELRKAVDAFQVIPVLPDDNRVMVAKSLARLGDVGEADRILSELITRRPKAARLRLDYVDAMMTGKRYRIARRELENARELAPDDLRLQRLDGALHMTTKHYERAVAPLEAAVRLRPDDASARSDLGWAYRESGCWRPALSAWCRSWALGKQDTDLGRTIQELRFEFGPWGSAFGHRRFAGADRVWQAGAAARVPLTNERMSLALRTEWGDYSGLAEAAGGRVTDAVGTIDASGRLRFGRRHYADGGLSGYLDRDNGPGLSPWAAVRLEGQGPYRYLKVEGFVDRLWSEPAAAVGLGGARSGLTAEGWHDLGCCWWTSGMLSYQQLSLTSGVTGKEEDGFATWRAEIGRRLLTSGATVSARVAYSGSRLLDDKELAQSVPIGTRFDFLTGAIYAERHLGMRWYATFEGYAGSDLANPGFLWGAEGTLRLDLASTLRLRFAAGFGSQARFQDGDSGHFDVALDWIF